MKPYTITAFYKFSKLTNLESLKAVFKSFCTEYGIRGTLLLAKEGFNATLAGEDKHIQSLLMLIRTKLNCSNLQCKFSYSDTLPFKKLKVLIKKEIITMKMSGLDIESSTGVHLSPAEWNKIISDPEVLVIDTRNNYEIEHGTFRNAVNPNTEQFSDFPEYVQRNLDKNKHKKIAMYCTGGIRCEKASAYLLQEGFEEVYQLQGGILHYLEKMDPAQSLWKGQCFIFDERVTWSLGK